MILFQPNLLPPQVRDETRYEILARVLLRLGVLSAALVIFFSILLIPTYVLVNLSKGEILRQVAAEEQNPATKRVTRIDDTLEISNQRIRRLKNLLANQNTLSAVLAAVLADAPLGITFQHFVFDREAKSLVLTGHARARADILELDKRLKKLPVVSGVDLPLQSLVNEADIDFTLKLLLKS